MQSGRLAPPQDTCLRRRGGALASVNKRASARSNTAGSERERVGQVPASFRGQAHGGVSAPGLYADGNNGVIADEIAGIDLYLPFDAVLPNCAFIADPCVEVGFVGCVKRMGEIEGISAKTESSAARTW